MPSFSLHWDASLRQLLLLQIKLTLVNTEAVEPELQFPGSGSNFKHLNFLVPAPAPTSKRFWLRMQNYLVHDNRKNITEICTTRVPHKLGLWDGSPNFGVRLRLHQLKVFGSGSGSSSDHQKLIELRLHSPG